jgi:hypothetical protein
MRESGRERLEAKGARLSSPAIGRTFWDGVEKEIEAMDPNDLFEFLSPSDVPPFRRGFERALEAHLRAFFCQHRRH